MNELSQGQELAKQLLMDDRNGVEKVGAEEIYQADLFCENYKQFLDCGKTEREVAAQVTAMLQQNGYRPFVPQTAYQPGDKVFLNNRGKAIIACTIGRQPVSAGVHIAAAHIDSPRLDLKQRPLYEEKDLALFKTHYYGGIKKYQWTAIPLALHGVIVKQSGEVVPVCVGESADDPVFCVTDLLPHLAAEQMKRTLGDGVKGGAEHPHRQPPLLGRQGVREGQAEHHADPGPEVRHHRAGLPLGRAGDGARLQGAGRGL